VSTFLHLVIAEKASRAPAQRLPDEPPGLRLLLHADGFWREVSLAIFALKNSSLSKVVAPLASPASAANGRCKIPPAIRRIRVPLFEHRRACIRDHERHGAPCRSQRADLARGDKKNHCSSRVTHRDDGPPQESQATGHAFQNDLQPLSTPRRKSAPKRAEVHVPALPHGGPPREERPKCLAAWPRGSRIPTAASSILLSLRRISTA